MTSRSVLGTAAVLVITLTACREQTDADTRTGQGTSPTRSSASSSAPAPPSATQAPSPAPQGRGCRALPYEAAQGPLSDDSPIVPCGTPRATSWTYTVEQLPEGWDGLDRTDPSTLQAGLAACDDAATPLLGESQDPSLNMPTILSSVAFLPPARDWQLGARWVRCDLVADSRAAHQLEPLPSQLSEIRVTDPSLPTAYRLCSATSLARDQRVEPVGCRHRHRMYAASTLDLGQGAYPGAKAVRQRARRLCARSARSWQPSVTPSVSTPTRQDWESDRPNPGTCWAETSGTP